MITVTVNGKARELESPTSLMTFLQDMKVNFRFLAVGYNGEVLPKADYGTVVLRDGDVLEVVRPIGGGADRSPACGSASAPRGFR